MRIYRLTLRNGMPGPTENSSLTGLLNILFGFLRLTNTHFKDF